MISKIVQNKTWSKTLKIGDAGENYLRDFCKQYNIQYKKATVSENMVDGIDAYFAGIPTDVKTTPKIFLCKYILSMNKLFVRHPFRKETKAMNYCVIDQNPPLQFRYIGSINEYLLKNYFKSETSLRKVKEALQSFEEKSFQQLKKRSADELMLSIKNDIMHHLKEKIYCTYVSIDQARGYNIDELNICLLTYADHQQLIREGKRIF